MAVARLLTLSFYMMKVCFFAAVVAGAATPLLRPLKVCPEIHGDSGLDGHEIPALPESVKPLPGKAIFEAYSRISGHHAATGQTVVLIATGSLTNVALLLAVRDLVLSSARFFLFFFSFLFLPACRISVCSACCACCLSPS